MKFQLGFQIELKKTVGKFAKGNSRTMYHAGTIDIYELVIYGNGMCSFFPPYIKRQEVSFASTTRIL